MQPAELLQPPKRWHTRSVARGRPALPHNAMAPYQGESLRASWAGGASPQIARPSAARAPRRGQRGGGCRRQNVFESAIAPPLECEGQPPRLARRGSYVDTNETGVDFLMPEQRAEADRAAVSDPAQRTTVRSLRKMPAQVTCVNFPQPRVCDHDEFRRHSSIRNFGCARGHRKRVVRCPPAFRRAPGHARRHAPRLGQQVIDETSMIY
jgi:hypothetical protein